MADIRIYLSHDIELNPGTTTFLNFGHLKVRSINNIEKFDEILVFKQLISKKISKRFDCRKFFSRYRQVIP